MILPPTANSIAAFTAALDAGRRRHRNRQVAWPAGPDDEVIRSFSRAHLTGNWRICGRAGVLAVQDLPESGEESSVWLGSDSVRFFDLVCRALPASTGQALEIGSGSGLTTCGLALRYGKTVAVDLVEEAVTATEVAAGLNGVADAVDSRCLGLEELLDSASDRFGVVVANLPGVPVPPGVAYSPAGDGGEDGLRLVNLLLKGASRLLDKADGRLIMRFQSLGSPEGLLCDSLIEELCSRYKFDCFVESDQRVPISVRAFLTAQYAERHSSGHQSQELQRMVTSHYEALDCDAFYSSNLVLTAGGSGRYRRTDTTRSAVTAQSALLDLPDEFFELGGESIWPLLEDRLRDLAETRSVPETVEALTGAVADALGRSASPGQRAAASIVFERVLGSAA